MAKAKQSSTKTDKNAAKKSPAPAAAPEPMDEAVSEPVAPLSAEEFSRLLRVGRFLVKVAMSDLDRVRAKVGYTAEEHRLGWSHYRVAAGEGQPLQVDADVPVEGIGTGLLGQLDDFENKWFPRTRRIIERYVPASHRQGVLDAFFKDLAQQRLGPAVVASVSTYLDRVESLGNSTVPGAATARAELARRGVDAATVTRLRRLLDEARALKTGAPAPTVDPQRTLQERRAAYEALWLWWKDWRETFASEVNGRLRRELGLVNTSVDGTEPAEPDAPAG